MWGREFQSVALDGVQMRPARDQHHLVTALEQLRANNPANAARAVYYNPHVFPFDRSPF
jgi:hypothetical protein